METNMTLSTTPNQSSSSYPAPAIRVREQGPEIPKIPVELQESIEHRNAELQRRVFGMLDRGNALLKKIPSFFDSKYYRELLKGLDKLQSRGNWLLNHIDIAKELTSEEMDDFIRGKRSKFSIKHKKMYSYLLKIRKSIHI